MLVSQKLDVGQDEEQTQHLQLKWHFIKDFLAVSSFIPSKGGFLSFYTKKASIIQNFKNNKYLRGVNHFFCQKCEKIINLHVLLGIPVIL